MLRDGTARSEIPEDLFGSSLVGIRLSAIERIKMCQILDALVLSRNGWRESIPCNVLPSRILLSSLRVYHKAGPRPTPVSKMLRFGVHACRWR